MPSQLVFDGRKPIELGNHSDPVCLYQRPDQRREPDELVGCPRPEADSTISQLMEMAEAHPFSPSNLVNKGLGNPIDHL